MANLIPVSQWVDAIEISLTDRVKGGPDGVINVQAKQLLDRTEYLKDNKAGKTEIYTQLQIDGFIDALSAEIVTNAEDIDALESAMAIANANILTNTNNINAYAKNATGWLDGARTSSKINAANFYCKVQQIGKIVYVTGTFELTSAPNEGDVLITLPAAIGIPKVRWHFGAVDAADNENVELYAYEFNRYICCGNNPSTGRQVVFGTSYPII